MPARLIEPVARELDFRSPVTESITPGKVRDSIAFSEEGAPGVPQNYVIIYEHRDFEDRDRIRVLAVTEHQPQLTFSLHVMDFKDCLSSLRWNLDEGIVVQFSENHEGGGRIYQIWGSGEDADTHNNGFGDRASSWSWYRTR